DGLLPASKLAEGRVDNVQDSERLGADVTAEKVLAHSLFNPQAAYVSVNIGF
ncbi:unnamed protein product, partial [Effrenium voratum]